MNLGKIYFFYRHPFISHIFFYCVIQWRIDSKKTVFDICFFSQNCPLEIPVYQRNSIYSWSYFFQI